MAGVGPGLCEAVGRGWASYVGGGACGWHLSRMPNSFPNRTLPLLPFPLSLSSPWEQEMFP